MSRASYVARDVTTIDHLLPYPAQALDLALTRRAAAFRGQHHTKEKTDGQWHRKMVQRN